MFYDHLLVICQHHQLPEEDCFPMNVALAEMILRWSGKGESRVFRLNILMQKQMFNLNLQLPPVLFEIAVVQMLQTKCQLEWLD